MGIDTLTSIGPAHVLVWAIKPISYARHQFPPDVIRHAVWLYFRFTLSCRDVEDLLAERGLTISACADLGCGSWIGQWTNACSAVNSLEAQMAPPALGWARSPGSAAVPPFAKSARCMSLMLRSFL
jgi:hypothetical protein